MLPTAYSIRRAPPPFCDRGSPDFRSRSIGLAAQNSLDPDRAPGSPCTKIRIDGNWRDLRGLTRDNVSNRSRLAPRGALTESTLWSGGRPVFIRQGFVALGARLSRTLGWPFRSAGGFSENKSPRVLHSFRIASRIANTLRIVVATPSCLRLSGMASTLPVVPSIKMACGIDWTSSRRATLESKPSPLRI
jgi:hypothetical protein